MNDREKRLLLLPFICTPDEDTMLKNMGKYTFKVCEAVALGMSHYYMGKNDRRPITESERQYAMKIIPTLPDGWMVGADRFGWSCMNQKNEAAR